MAIKLKNIVHRSCSTRVIKLGIGLGETERRQPECIVTVKSRVSYFIFTINGVRPYYSNVGACGVVLTGVVSNY